MLQLTINSGAAAHAPSTWDNSSASVEVWARSGDMEGDRSAVWREVLDISTGLDVAREIA